MTENPSTALELVDPGDEGEDFRRDRQGICIQRLIHLFIRFYPFPLDTSFSIGLSISIWGAGLALNIPFPIVNVTFQGPTSSFLTVKEAICRK